MYKVSKFRNPVIFFKKLFYFFHKKFLGADLRTQNRYRYSDEKLFFFYTRVTGINKFFGLGM